MDTQKTRAQIDRSWDESIVPALERYIAIPNQSPAFDRDWRQHGFMEQAVELIAGWIRAQEVPGLSLEVVRLGERSPLIFVEIPGDAPGTVLLYGHLDKQPPMEPWRDGLGPWKPVREGNKLYGRGAADDGYSAFAAIAAIHALKRQGVPCGRCVLIIEACEESGSHDLPHYIEALAARIGTPGLVVGLDSGCGDYQRLWMTTSLRGLISGTLSVSTLTEGVHSGAASGIVPSTFRIARQLLSRLEDEKTGAIVPRELYVEIPAQRRRQAEATANILGATVYSEFPFQAGTSAVSNDTVELMLNRCWRPQIEITGADGLPPSSNAGNVLRPSTKLVVSLRLPPTSDARAASQQVKALLESDPPYGAQVTFKAGQGARGWSAPPLAPWLEESVHRASREFYGADACFMGEGGTIPFMAMLGEKFPQAQFLITGVLGPHSNAHGPNEFLEVDYAAKLTGCVARVLADHAARH